MLFLPPGSSQLMRAQGAFIRDEDLNRVLEYIEKQASPSYLIKSFDEMAKENILPEESSLAPQDDLYSKALTIVLQTRTASTTFLQRKLKIGYARAAGLMDELEDRGVISPQDGAKPRRILVDSTDM